VRAALATIIVAGCASSVDDAPTAKLEDLVYARPAEWTETTTTHANGIATTLWMPANNPNKESIEIVRGDPRIGVPADTLQLTQLLTRAQRELPRARISTAMPFATSSGRVGVRIDAEFEPVGLHRAYHRTHAVLVEPGGVVVHVMYTAATPDAQETIFNAVIESIHREEA